MENARKVANKVSVITMFVNIVLALGKLVAGIIGRSGAMISDAIHSASDVLSTIAVMIGINLSSKEDDSDHQYGHEKIESIVAVVLSMLLFATAIGIGTAGVRSLMSLFSGQKIPIPTMPALLAAGMSIIIKEWMYWYTRFAAKKIDSCALLADAWHHRSDALSSVGSLIGIGGAMMGLTFLDPLVSILICGLIIKVSYNIAKVSVDQLVDKAASTEQIEIITNAANSIEGVMQIDEIKTRVHSTKVYVDIEISVDGDLSARSAHDIAEKVHDNVEEKCKEVKHIMVHVNPL